MKTAISLPDEIFEEAEAFARRLGISRSELYATAIAGYVSEHRKARVTEKLNDVYGEGTSALDPVLSAMQLSSLEKDEW
jgi:metal-responsive CopG/Arc/MetJ family transcriptional regulator